MAGHVLDASIPWYGLDLWKLCSAWCKAKAKCSHSRPGVHTSLVSGKPADRHQLLEAGMIALGKSCLSVRVAYLLTQLNQTLISTPGNGPHER
jgi:hypothetical protein